MAIEEEQSTNGFYENGKTENGDIEPATKGIDYDELIGDDEIDVSDIDYSDLEAKFSVPAEKLERLEDFSNFLVVCGLPSVDSGKAPKLRMHLAKNVIGMESSGVSSESIYMPESKDGNNATLGYAFITCPDADTMRSVAAKLDRFPLDKSHRLSAIPFDEVDHLLGLEDGDDFHPPEDALPPYKQLENVWDWLMDEAGRDQLLLYREFDVSIGWAPQIKSDGADSGADGSPNLLGKKGKHLTDKFSQWSPSGTYLMTAHLPGVLLWAGPNFERFGRYAHNGVCKMFMSPGENFLVTCSKEPVPLQSSAGAGDANQPTYNVLVWDVRTKQVIRAFNVSMNSAPAAIEDADEENGATKPPKSHFVDPEAANESWPWIKWSLDEAYVARIVPGSGSVVVYTLPGMQVLDKKPLNVENVQDFAFSPKSGVNALALWSPEAQNSPARILLMDLPSRKIIRSKNIFSVKSVEINWSNIDFLSFHVDRWIGKAKTTFYPCLEVFGFDSDKRDVTFSEALELRERNIFALEWEPNGGKRFLLGTRATDSSGIAVIAAPSIFSLYEYDATATPGSQVKLIKTLTRSKSVDRIYWSPKGRFAVLAASNGEGQLEFWNIPRDVSSGNSSIELMSSQEHYLMGSAAWDPSGRYVVSIASSRGGQRASSETGYVIYDFRGTLIERFGVPQMKQCLWRPRPPTLLTGSHLKRIRKDLAKYSAIFTEQDRKRRQKASLATSMHLLKLREEWQAWCKTWAKTLAEEKSERASLLKIDQSSAAKISEKDDYEEIQEIVEQVLEETIEDAPLQEGEDDD